MLKRILFLSILVLGISERANAQVFILSANSPLSKEVQTHQCDSPAAPNPTISGAIKVGYCFDNKMADGSQILNATVTTKVYVGSNTTPSWTGTATVVNNTLSAGGYKYYETGSFTPPVGSNTIKLTVTVGGNESKASLPFTFNSELVLPNPPVVIQIVK